MYICIHIPYHTLCMHSNSLCAHCANSQTLSRMYTANHTLTCRVRDLENFLFFSGKKIFQENFLFCFTANHTLTCRVRDLENFLAEREVQWAHDKSCLLERLCIYESSNPCTYNICVCVYVYAYVCVCVCACVFLRSFYQRKCVCAREITQIEGAGERARATEGEGEGDSSIVFVVGEYLLLTEMRACAGLKRSAHTGA